MVHNCKLPYYLGVYKMMAEIAGELILESSSPDFGGVEIPDKFCDISSSMPQKKNPYSIELLRGSYCVRVGNCMSSMMIADKHPMRRFRRKYDVKDTLKERYCKECRKETVVFYKMLGQIIRESKFKDRNLRRRIWAKYAKIQDKALKRVFEE